MVVPSAFAETATPPIFSPAAELMVPDRMPSAAAGSAQDISNATRPVLPSSFFMGRLSLVSARGRRRRHGLEVGDDGGDLRRFELIFESRHARRAVADHLPHHVFASARRIPGQRWTIERRRGDLRLEVADGAGLNE